jgi:glycerol-3-phosphate acyltransferase PlsY
LGTVFAVVLSAVTGYLLGSANSALIVGKFYGIDVRKHGSGNAGLTNTLRTLGKKAALLVLIGDFAKGIVACLVGYMLWGKLGVMAAGTGAILGHNWPLYFRFKGGKGVLTSIAVVIMMDWKIALIVIGIFTVLVAATRFVSLGSIAGAALFPVIALLLNRSSAFILFALFIALLIIFRHRTNIVRILAGNEAKLGSKKA